MTPDPSGPESSKAKDLVVFDIVRQSKCAECGKELLGGDFLFMESARPLCLTCADLDHLVYLPRGDTALTRNVPGSTARSLPWWFALAGLASDTKRQECWLKNRRSKQAEAECSADAEQRSVRRERAEIYRDKQDQVLAVRMAESIRQMFRVARRRSRGPSRRILRPWQRPSGSDCLRTSTRGRSIASSGGGIYTPQTYQI
jgi:hypothetical protein